MRIFNESKSVFLTYIFCKWKLDSDLFLNIINP